MSQSRLRQTVLPLDPDEFGVDQAGYTDIPGSPPLFDPPSSKRSHRDASTSSRGLAQQQEKNPDFANELPRWMQGTGSQQDEESHLEGLEEVNSQGSSNASITDYGGNSTPSTSSSSIDLHNISSDSSK